MKIRTGIAVLLLFPITGITDGFEYTFVEAGFVSSDIKDGRNDADGNGIGIAGSYAFSEQVHFIAEYVDQSFDSDIDTTTISLGAGINHVLNEDWDLIGQLSYVSLDMDTASGSKDDGGLGLMGGVRGRIRPNIEVDAGLNYIDVRGSDTSLFVSGRYYVRETFSIGGGLTLDDGDTALNITVRALFGGRTSSQ